MTVTGGAQDNGTSMWNGSSWDYILGGDGMETLIDWSDADVIYGSQYNGSLNRSTDGGNSWDYITPNSSGAWVTPYIIHPTNPQILYGGYTGIWKKTNRGNSWTELTSAINIGQLDALEISRSNPNYIYGASSGTLYRTTDGGNNWTMLFSPSGSSSNITYIAISDTDPNKIWVTYSGYTNDEHVYKSLDAGDTWTNVSINLPNLPVNCVVYQSGSTNDAIYIGNDEGVYYINNDMSEWVSYNNGLPKVIVKELEIQYSSSKLRAATYGRGMFESDLYTTQSGTADAGISHILTPGGTSCVNTQVSPLVVIKNYGTQNLTYADINYSFNNTKYTFQWTGNLATGDTSAFYLPEIILANGNYTFTVSSDHPNSALDADGSNDTTITTFSTAQIAQAIPYSQDFESTFPPIGTTTKSYDVTVGWAKGVSANANSSGSAYMKNFTYTAKGQRDEFILPLLDFTPLQDPALFFDLAYTTANTLSSDTLLINVSTDCGATYTTVYKKWGADLTTIGAPQATEFTPDTTQWREEGINLEAFKGESEVLINFININAKQNNLFVDNINIRSEFGVNTKNISTESIVLYPSAANDKIKVSGLNNQYNKASVIDVKGSCIKKLEFEAGNELELNISDLKDGMYFIKLGNGEKVLKFQKVD